MQVDKSALERLSRLDPLTGLGNRRQLSDWLAAWHADPQCETRLLAVVMLDVDHFKRYNDQHGHPAGDACLKRVAIGLGECMREGADVLVRYGGEEFAALLPGADEAEAEAVAKRLCEAIFALAMPHPSRGDGIACVTVSAGVSVGRAGSPPQAQALFEAADAALYVAKQGGRNRHAVGVASASTNDAGC